MADDGVTLNVNTHHKEDGPERPSSAGGQLNDEQRKREETLNRDAAKSSQEAAKFRDDVKSFFDAIKAGDDTPIDSVLPPSSPAVGGGGGGASIPPSPPGPPGLPPSEPPPEPPNYGANGGAMVPYTGGGSLVSTAAGTAMQVASTSTAVAPAATAGAGAMAAGGATAGATAATAAAGAALLIPVIGEVIIALGGFAAALFAQVAILDRMFHELLETWEEVSGVIQYEKGRQKAELIVEKLDTEPRIRDETEFFYEAETSVLKELIHMKAVIVEIIAPTLIVLLSFVKVILFVLNLILEILGLIMNTGMYALRIMKGAWKKLGGWWGSGNNRMLTEAEMLVAGNANFGVPKPSTRPRPFGRR